VTSLAVEGLCFSYGATSVLRNVEIEGLEAGQVAAVIGPNAAGKSTFFKCLAGLLKGSGRILLDGTDTGALRPAEVSRRITYMPQENRSSAVLTVFEAILLARQHSVSWRVSDDDLLQVMETMDALQVDDLSLRYLNELSGGQKQLVSIAQAIVRNPDVLLMDEPTNNLDLQRQLEVLELVRAVTLERGMMTLVALHDLNLAARYTDRLIVMHRGEVYACGLPRDILTPQLLRDIYGIEAAVTVDEDGFPIVIPRRSARSAASRMAPV
jgi:iron complex transport system ATP-binding protein